MISSTYPALLHTFTQDTMTSSNSINIEAMTFPESVHIQAVSIKNYKIYQFLFDIGTGSEHNIPTFFIFRWTVYQLILTKFGDPFNNCPQQETNKR